MFSSTTFVSRCYVCEEKHEPKCAGHEEVVEKIRYEQMPVASQKQVDDLKAEIQQLKEELAAARTPTADSVTSWPKVTMLCRPNCRRITGQVNVGFCMNCKDRK